MINYKNLSEKDKKTFLINQYETLQKSFADIAKETNTYANKLRRDCLKFNIKIRNKSEAQKNALSNGRTDHPTKGKQRSVHTKHKIGLGVLKSWEDLTEEELNARKEKAKYNWEKLSDDDKENILREANKAVRQASKSGSKLENFIFEYLLQQGFSVDFHKEQSILNTKLQIDIFIPKYNIAIEVDGPSHFEPVWGDDTLKRNKKYDNKKTGLILGKGLYLIRIKQTRDFSKSRALLVCYKLLENIQDIINNKKLSDKIINIGDD